MHSPSRSVLWRIFRFLLSASVIIAGICLMVACYSIYCSGDQPYSPGSVAAAFSCIAIPVYFCMAMVILDILSWPFGPQQKEKQRPEKNLPLILSHLRQKADLSRCDSRLQAGLQEQKMLRKRLYCLTVSTTAAGFLCFLLYVLLGADFSLEDINGSVIRCVLVLLPCLAIPFAIGIITTYRSKHSMAAEIALLRQLPLLPRPAPEDTAEKPVKALPVARIVLLVLASGLLIYGALNGGTADVLVKAVNICTECVGLG